jgi:2-dehydro-3-deoxygluconokinase
MPVELLTFGEAMVRLSPPGGRRLEQATALDVHVGGSELNAAVAATRMGLSCAFVTRLTENGVGRLIANRVREHGVDASHILWTEADRVGTYYLEYGAAPRANRVLYDRADSAMARIVPGMLPWSEILDGVSLFYTSGITAALTTQAAEATIEAVEAANAAGARVCVDLNYRARLWSQKRAREVMTEIVHKTDILFTTEEDTQRVFGIEEDGYDAVARRLAEQFSLEIVAITLRQNPSVWRNQWTAIAYEAATDTIHEAPSFDIEVVDRVGSGDAFVGGFLYGYLREDTTAAVRYGVALSAIKQTHHGDLVYATRDEVEAILGGGSLRISR